MKSPYNEALQKTKAATLPVMYSIDPGLQGTGWAEWSRDNTLLRCGVLTTPSGMAKQEFEDRAAHLCSQFVELLPRHGHTVSIYCEFPQYFAGATKVMGWKTGDLQRLVFLVGMLAGRSYPNPLTPVPVNTWKGQLPKPVTQRRIQDILTHEVCQAAGIESHAWDAVGVGLWAQGRF